MGKGTGARIREEMIKKGMTKSERTFEALSKKGKGRELDIMDFQQQ